MTWLLSKNVFANKCPKCKREGIYASLLTIKHKCSSCGLNLGKAQTADGPAFFVMSIWGTIACLLVLYVEINEIQPIWLYRASYLPVIVWFSVVLLKYFKTVMVYHQYKLGQLDD